MTNPVMVARLFDALKHGDDEHRAWLKGAINAFFEGRPIPAPRGSGNKAARITALEADKAALVEALEQQADGSSMIAALLNGQKSAVAASLIGMSNIQEQAARATLAKHGGGND